MTRNGRDRLDGDALPVQGGRERSPKAMRPHTAQMGQTGNSDKIVR